MNSRIALANEEQEILDCYAIMAELRPHLQMDEFLPIVKRLAEIAGYRLAYLTNGEVKAVAGFRISEWLAGGKYLEIEDLIAKSGERSKGLRWLASHQNRRVERDTGAHASRDVGSPTLSHKGAAVFLRAVRQGDA